ncbi:MULTISPECIES: hypothetical protein [unclassified Nocardioides]|nr:hypothetical protein [Nocardioides sp. Arc9.136]WKN48973.1 hypothetical protein OSR43_02270 [Nocardioides sp. Arc9.136]
MSSFVSSLNTGLVTLGRYGGVLLLAAAGSLAAVLAILMRVLVG